MTDDRRVIGRSVMLTALGCAALALVPKVVLHLAGAAPFNADEAVVGLMARHILAGARPLFFYGQAYMGSLDAFLVAGLFTVIGPSVAAIRIVQGALYALTVFLAVLLAHRIYGDARLAAFAGLLLALPNVNTTLYTSVSLGGYGEALVFGALLLLLALRLTDGKSGVLAFGMWGFVATFGFWAFALTLVFSLPGLVAVAAALHRSPVGRKERIAGGLAGALLGLVPWGLGVSTAGWLPALREVTGSAVVGASPDGLIASLASHLANLAVLGSTVLLGLRPPWEVRWLALPLAPLVLALWMGAAIYVARAVSRHDAARMGRGLLVSVMLVTLVAFVVLPFGADPSGRYFLPLTIPMAVLGAEALRALHRRTPALAWAALGVVLLFHAAGLVQCMRRNPPGVTTQFDSITWIDHRYDAELQAFLSASGERRGYTNYWVAYPLAFLSGEDLLYIPALPYHSDLRFSTRDDRYPPYAEEVAASDRVAYITTHHPSLDARLRAGLAAAGITWHETWIGDYHVFHDLARPVGPQDLDLMEGTQASGDAIVVRCARSAAGCGTAGTP